MKKAVLFFIPTMYLAAQLAMRLGALPPVMPDAGASMGYTVVLAMAMAIGAVLPPKG